MEKLRRSDRDGKAARAHEQAQAKISSPGRRTLPHEVEAAQVSTADVVASLARAAQVAASFSAVLSLGNGKVVIQQAAAVRVVADLLHTQLASLSNALKAQWEQPLTSVRADLLRLLARAPNISREAIDAGRLGSWTKWDEEIAAWDREVAGGEELSSGEIYRVNTQRNSIVASRKWLEADTDFAKTHSAPTKILQCLVELQRQGSFPWATPTQLAELALLPATDVKILTAHFDYGIHAYALVGLPPASSAVVELHGDTLRIAVRVDGPDGPIEVRGDDIRRIFAAAAAFTGQEIRPALLASVESLSSRLHRKAGRVYLELQGADLFGSDVWNEWKQNKGSVNASEPSVVASELTPAELARANTWLDHALPPLVRAWLPKASRASLQQIDAMIAEHFDTALLRSAYVLRFGEHAAPARSLEEVLTYLRYEFERQQVLGPRVAGATSGPVHPFLPVQAPASIISRQERVFSDLNAVFELYIDWKSVQLAPDKQKAFEKTHESINIEWVFERSDRRAPKEIKRTGSGVANHAFHLGWGEPNGAWRVHAFVESEQFQPTHVVTDVVVQTEQSAFLQLTSTALGREELSAVPAWKTHEFARTGGEIAFDDKHDFEGYRYQSAMPFEAQDFDARMKTRETELQHDNDLRKYYTEQSGDHSAVIEAVDASRERVGDEIKSLKDDKGDGWKYFDIRAAYLSKTVGVQSGSLEIWGEVRTDANHNFADPARPIMVRLRDFSRRNGHEALSYTGSGTTFEGAFEAAFLSMSKDYPIGRLAIFAQEMTPNGKRPTGNMVGFELTTSSRTDRAQKAVFSGAVQLATAGALAVLGLVFPPALPFTILIDTVYNVTSVAVDISEQERRGTLTGRHTAFQLAGLAMTLLPYARSAELIAASRLGSVAMFGVEYGGQVILMREQFRDTLASLYANDVAALASLYEDMVEAEKAADDDPRLPMIRAQFDERATAIRFRTLEAFQEAALQQGLMAVPGHLRELAGVRLRAASLEHASSFATHAEPNNENQAVGNAEQTPSLTPEKHEATRGPAPDVAPGERREVARELGPTEAARQEREGAARREAERKALGGEHGHARIEVHSHFMGRVLAETFRERAQKASGTTGEPSWIPLLKHIDALREGTDGAKLKHVYDAAGAITKRGQAGDALNLVRNAIRRIESYREQIRIAGVDASSSQRLAIEAIAEKASRAALGASPETTYDGSYELRDGVMKRDFGSQDPKLTDVQRRESALDDFTREALLVIAEQVGGYVEESLGLNKLEKSFTPERILRNLRELVSEGRIKPGALQVDFLAMMHTKNFGDKDPRTGTGEPRTSDADFQRDVSRIENLQDQGDVVGWDVGAPETNEWDAAGEARLEDLIKRQVELEKRTGTKSVHRPHAGEAVVDNLPGMPFNTDKDRFVIGDQLSHYIRGEKNIEAFLNVVEKLRRSGEIDSTAIIRIGHATHASPEQLQRMQEAGIYAEVNLGSNVVTGSVSQTEGLFGKRSEREQLEAHSFSGAIYYEVRTLLSTDGNAVMDTTLAKEFSRAFGIIDAVLRGEMRVLVDLKSATTDRVRGGPTSDPNVRALHRDEFTQVEFDRFANAHTKLYDDAKHYYLRRPNPGQPTSDSPFGGAHHVDIARKMGLVSKQGTAQHVGSRAQVDAAVTSYRLAGYAVKELSDTVFQVEWVEKRQVRQTRESVNEPVFRTRLEVGDTGSAIQELEQ